MPLPPMEVTCEFDLLIGEFIRPTGRVVAVVFHGLTLTTKKKRASRNGNQKDVRPSCRPPGREAEKDGVGRIQVRDKRSDAA